MKYMIPHSYHFIDVNVNVNINITKLFVENLSLFCKAKIIEMNKICQEIIFIYQIFVPN